MNGRDLSRIVRNPRAMMNLQAGNMGAVEAFLADKRREDARDEARRLLIQMGGLTAAQVDYRLRDAVRLRDLQRTLKGTHGEHPLYRRAQALLDELTRG
jgi:hypothetical protein